MNEINWISMLLSTITPLVVGYIIYHPKLFGTESVYAVGTHGSAGKKVGSVISVLIASFFLSFFLLNFNNDGINQEGDFDNFAHGAWHGLFLSVTVVLPIIVISGLVHQWTWKRILIGFIYWIITLVLMGGIVDAMNHWENVVIAN